MKKTLALALSLLLVAPTAFVACGEDGGETKKVSIGLEYVLSDDGTYYSVKGKGTCTDTELCIPDEYEGKPVRNIQDSAFWNDEGLTALSIGNNVEEIGFSAFSFCDNLKEISFGEKLKKIEYAAFSYVNNVNAYTVASNNATYTALDGSLYTKDMKTLVYYAGGKKDKKFTVPSTVTIIGQEAFFKCDNLEEVVISDGVESLGMSALSYCDNLKKISIGKNLRILGSGTFVGSDKLKDVTISEENANFQMLDGVIYSKDGKILHLYLPSNTETSYVVKDGVTTVSAQAIYFNSYLQSVTISDSVEMFGNAVFAGCNNLKEVRIGSGLKTIGAVSFDYCESLERFIVSEDNPYLQAIDGNLYQTDKTSGKADKLLKYALGSTAESLEIPDGVERIDDRACSGAKNLKSVTIPQSVNLIGYQAFSSCPSLKNATFANVQNWYIGWSPVALQGTDIEPSQLQDSGVAAKLLSETYVGYEYWICREQI